MHLAATTLTLLASLSFTSAVPQPVIEQRQTNATAVLEARQERAGLELLLFSGRHCEGESWGRRVHIGTCAPTNPGFSSVKILKKYENQFGGPNVVTIYTRNDCGCPTCGSHGYNTHAGQCLEFPEFVGNAIGVL
ncbi:hypothetical protein QBC34DRAFT_466169 [Podospora aff. communis PSN243]|uniref:Uncharacterized protein n=1 Tax=Podospora aff. communis PSN243 TaxID=3040156 RepID=A0AAV9GHM8_9PEZI|nr:hypothetical protein QBC34DRAFT_466169 [Podospora aff. communis PSN243]